MTSEWPDKEINSLLEEPPQGFHFHQIIFNNVEIANLNSRNTE